AGAVSEKRAIEGGLGPAGAEVLAEAGSGTRLSRVGLADTFAEGARSGPWLFRKYGLTTQNVVDAAWRALGREGEAPTAEPVRSEEHTSELQSRENLVCRLLLEKKKLLW